jgi:hypothetical protein
MRRVVFGLVALLFASAAYGQDSTPSGPPAAAALSQAPRTMLQGMPRRTNLAAAKGTRYKPEIPVSATVITLDGVCAQPPAATKGAASGAKPATAKAAAPCKTVVTRGQLDALLESIDPSPSPKERQQFAINYARLLAGSQLAEQKHLDQSPEVTRTIQAKQKMARMQVLTDAMLQVLQREAAHVPPKEVEAYYKQYAGNFEQAEVRRVAIPLSAPTEDGKPIDQAAAKAKMEELRTAAIQGDSFDDLQARAYKAFNIKGDVPHTELTLMRRSGFSTDEAKVFEMDPGATTPVFEDAGMVVMLQVISHKTQSLTDSQSEIEAVLLQQRLKEQLQVATKGITADFNLKYMDSKAQPELFPSSVITMGAIRRGMLSSMHVQPQQ